MAVIGTGLIGTSVALAASRQGVLVYLSDRNRSTARTAAALGAGLARTPPEQVDLAVLAVPPSQVGTVLAEAQERELALVYTDVASVKAGPERIALSRAPDPSRYIGGHPLAGRERSGPLAARADLFRDRPWALTPSPVTSDAAFNRALELVALCGAVPVVTRSRAHDDAVALTSHVPHLLASLMAARLRDAPAGMSRLAGHGLRDVTRIAGGDSRLWADILQSNAAAVAGVVRRVHADMSRLVDALDRLAGPDGGDRDEGMRIVLELLDRGVAGLAEVPGRRPGDPGGGSAVRVTVPDRPGELPRLLGAIADFGVDSEDAAVDADGTGALTVGFTVRPVAAARIVASLRAGGWEAGRPNGAGPRFTEKVRKGDGIPPEAVSK
ncbi:prephenate dehydrogenase [Kitasatospora putterlickiae]|uniref:Prephenate dehydrogenase n=2 Tax=Kitasatospora putterlickiae TaxID=221725 RepID=A0ABN1Y1V8_9ACTN